MTRDPILMLGQSPARNLTEKLARGFKEVTSSRGPVTLRTLQCGNDPAAEGYLKAIRRAFERVGVSVESTVLPHDPAAATIAGEIEQLNSDPGIDGVLLLEPLAIDVDHGELKSLLVPSKDVDCVTPARMGALFAGESSIAPATAAAVVQMLDEYDIPIEGKRAVVVGRSNTAGKPTALLLMSRHATITVCHSRTESLSEELRRAEIIVAAVGSPRLIRGEDVTDGVAVVDVGTNYLDDGLVGDVDFDSVAPKAAAITPVPKGIGPLTNVMLAANLLKLVTSGGKV